LETQAPISRAALKAGKFRTASMKAVLRQWDEFLVEQQLDVHRTEL